MPKEKSPRDRSEKTTRWGPRVFNQARCNRWIKLNKFDVDPLRLSQLLDGAISQYWVSINRPEEPSATETKASFRNIEKLSRKLKRELETLSSPEVFFIHTAARGDIDGLNKVLKERGLEPELRNPITLVTDGIKICRALEESVSTAIDMVPRSKVGAKPRDALNALVVSLAGIYSDLSGYSDNSPKDFVREVIQKLEIQFDEESSLVKTIERLLD